MARNWQSEDERRRERYGRDERPYGRGYGDDRNRGAYSDPRRLSGNPTYGSDFGASDPRAAWPGMDDGDHSRRWHDEGSYGGHQNHYPSYDTQSGRSARHDHEGYGGRQDMPYDEDRMERGGRSPYRNRNWSGGRSDWGRQEWGMSGPQQGGYDRGAYGRDPYAREHDRDERGFWDRASDEVASWFGDEDAERRRLQDQYRGRGPKNYSRSDDRIREDVSDRLTDDWRVDASEVEILVAKGEVTLSGTVSDRMQRRRAEDVAESVSGVHHVQNNLRVREAEGWSRDTSQGSATDTRSGATQTAVTPGQSSTVSSRNT